LYSAAYFLLLVIFIGEIEKKKDMNFDKNQQGVTDEHFVQLETHETEEMPDNEQVASQPQYPLTQPQSVNSTSLYIGDLHPQVVEVSFESIRFTSIPCRFILFRYV
jgi:hypothetical protein